MTPASLRSSPLSALAGATAVTFVVLLSVWVVIQPYPALQDFVEWMYQGFVLNRLMVGDPVALAGHYIAPYPVPNSLLQILLALANFLVDPVTAGKLVLLIYIWTFFILLWIVSRQLMLQYSGMALLVSAMIFVEAPTFWNGNLNFNFSLVLLTWYLYRAVIKDRETIPLIVVIGTLLAFTHAIGLSVFVLLVGVRNLIVRRRWGRLFALTPALALLAIYILAKPPDVPLSYAGYYEHPLYMVMYKAYTVMKLGVFHNFILGDGTSYIEEWPALYWVGVTINGLFGALLVIGVLGGAWRCLRHDRSAKRVVGLLVVGAIAGLFLAVPPFIVGIVNLGERYLLAGLLIATLLLPIDRRVLAGLSGLAVLAMPYFVGLFLLTAQAEVRDYPRPPTNAATLEDQVTANLPNTRLPLFAQRLYFFAWRAADLTRGDYRNLPDIHFGTGLVQARSWSHSRGDAQPQ